jgi:hypothetical protein
VTQPLDPEIKALRAILRALKPLPRDMRLRVLDAVYEIVRVRLRDAALAATELSDEEGT